MMNFEHFFGVVLSTEESKSIFKGNVERSEVEISKEREIEDRGMIGYF